MRGKEGKREKLLRKENKLTEERGKGGKKRGEKE